MASRQDLLRAGLRAAEVYRSSGAKQRVDEDGFTRVDPFAVAASEGVWVMLQPLESLLGAFLREASPGILVNSERPVGLVHMTCAHELGHFFMEHSTTADLTVDYGPNADRTESEAEWFAYQLLMPRPLLSKIMQRKSWTATSLTNPHVVYQLSLRLGMSFTATIWSLNRQNLLPGDRARAMARIQPRALKRELVGTNDQADNPSDVWLLDRSDQDLILEPRSTDRIVVDLPNHASAGFLWSIEAAINEGFSLRPVTVDARQHPVTDAETVRLGGGGRHQRYVLQQDEREAQSPDTHRVALGFIETQPWRSAEDGNDRFTTQAQFESLRTGLSAQSKAQAMEEIEPT